MVCNFCILFYRKAESFVIILKQKIIKRSYLWFCSNQNDKNFKHLWYFSNEWNKLNINKQLLIDFSRKVNALKFIEKL
jgi:hypothetical protein